MVSIYYIKLLANMSKGMDAKPPAYGLTSKAAGLHIDS